MSNDDYYNKPLDEVVEAQYQKLKRMNPRTTRAWVREQVIADRENRPPQIEGEFDVEPWRKELVEGMSKETLQERVLHLEEDRKVTRVKDVERRRLGRWAEAADEYDIETLEEILQIKTAMVKSQLSKSFDYNDFPFLTKDSAEGSDILKMAVYEQSAEWSVEENMEDITNIKFVINNYKRLQEPRLKTKEELEQEKLERLKKRSKEK
jgi:hypothetical protein